MARANAQGQDRRAVTTTSNAELSYLHESFEYLPPVALRWPVQQGITAVTATSNAELFFLHESFEYLPRPATGPALTDFRR